VQKITSRVDASPRPKCFAQPGKRLASLQVMCSGQRQRKRRSRRAFGAKPTAVSFGTNSASERWLTQTTLRSDLSKVRAISVLSNLLFLLSQDVSGASRQAWHAAPCSGLSSNEFPTWCSAQTGSFEQSSTFCSARARISGRRRAVSLRPPRVPRAPAVDVGGAPKPRPINRLKMGPGAAARYPHPWAPLGASRRVNDGRHQVDLWL